MKTHLEHPTQSAACGTRSTAHVLEEKLFRLSTHNRCRSCAKVLAAKDAGRPVHSGAESPSPSAVPSRDEIFEDYVSSMGGPSAVPVDDQLAAVREIVNGRLLTNGQIVLRLRALLSPPSPSAVPGPERWAVRYWHSRPSAWFPDEYTSRHAAQVAVREHPKASTISHLFHFEKLDSAVPGEEP